MEGTDAQAAGRTGHLKIAPTVIEPTMQPKYERVTINEVHIESRVIAVVNHGETKT